MSSSINVLAKTISDKMGSLIGVKVYVAVLNKEGDYIYSDEAFDEQQFDFIKKFVQTNFNYLKKGNIPFHLIQKT